MRSCPLPADSPEYLGETVLGNTALPVATGAGEGLATVAFGGCALGGDGATEGVGSVVASAPPCASRKSFHSHMLQHACGFKLANDGHGCINRRSRLLGQDFNLSNVKLGDQKLTCEALLK